MGISGGRVQWVLSREACEELHESEEILLVILGCSSQIEIKVPSQVGVDNFQEHF